MDIRCTVCGGLQQIAKWQEDFERHRQNQRDPIICDACRDKIRRDAQHQTFPR